jgi:hypothetical protein
MPESEHRTWDIPGITQALATAAEPIEDAAFGPGLRFALPAETAPNLTIYPASGVLRLTRPQTWSTARISLLAFT